MIGLPIALVLNQAQPQNDWTRLYADTMPVAQRVERVRSLRAEGSHESTALIVGALGDPDGNVVREAIDAVGRRRSPEAFRTLVRLAPTQVNRGGWETMYELFRYPYPEYRALYEELWDVPAPESRRVLTGSLAWRAEPAEFWRIVRRAKDPDGGVRWELVYNFQRYHDERFQRAMIGLLGHPDKQVQATAALALGIAGSQIALFPLERRQNAPDPAMRQAVTDALNRIRK